ncbi:MAG TPA: UDP binding domain-containing protein, partial [Acidimicrobiales bacterium]|nr:UDP binding domain-containing protein [Acidimicrobiales bacterium]
LPKDLRALLHLGRTSSVDLPLLTGALASNELSVRDVVQRVVASGGRTVALLGLSFKTQTDDLRESPYVEVAETLLGKGFDVRIYDPILEPARLVGTNLHYIQSKLPHLGRLLADSPATALEAADVAIVSAYAEPVVAALVANPPPLTLDLVGQLGDEVESLPGYQGAGW